MFLAYLAYKFRIYPNKWQKDQIAKTFGCARFIWNKMLEDKVQHYQETGKMLYNYPAQYKKRYEWLKEVDSMALCNVQMNLQKAYSNFFGNNKYGYPKFKSKKSNRQTYTTSNVINTIRLENGKLRLPKTGYVKISLHREIPQGHKIKTCTITKTPSGKYFASIMTEYDSPISDYTPDKSMAIGLDYSSGSFYVDSQGVEANYPKFFRKSETHIAREQRKLSKMEYGGKNYKKQRIKLDKMYEKVAFMRRDWLQKLSKKLADNWDYVCIEDINYQNMSQLLRLGKSTMDNGFGLFRTFLKYKLEEKGKKLVIISKWYPSTKTCHVCGEKRDLRLSERSWVCECGESHHRDVNAAINIRNEGVRISE